MPRLLVRAAKSPWTSVLAESVLTQNVIATNIGNLLFGQSVFRALSVEGTEVIANSYNAGRPGIDDRYIQRINDEFDGFVVPLANAFRPSFRRNLSNLTRVVENLNIPVTVVGVGSQHPLSGEGSIDSELDEDVKRFMAAVLDRSATVGVRGQETASYLRRLGFGDEHVEVIGCPSLFMHGPSPVVRSLANQFSEHGSLAMSASPQTGKVMVPIINDHAKRFERFRYIPQNSWDLNTLVWSEANPNPDSISELVATDSLLHRNDQIRFPLDPNTWVDYLRDFDFVVGTRIHGSVAGILAGAPTLLLAHDSRTRELADYHQIPYLPFDKVTEHTRVEDLYELADYTRFHSELPEIFNRFTSFLDKNNLPNIYQQSQKINDFDEKLNATDLPPMVHPVLAETQAGRQAIASRLRWLRQGKKVDNSRLRYAFKPDLPHTKKPQPTPKSVDARITKEVSALKDQLSKSQKQLELTHKRLDETRKLVDSQAKVIKRLDVPMAKRAKRYAKRLVTRSKE